MKSPVLTNVNGAQFAACSAPTLPPRVEPSSRHDLVRERGQLVLVTLQVPWLHAAEGCGLRNAFRSGVPDNEVLRRHTRLACRPRPRCAKLHLVGLVLHAHIPGWFPMQQSMRKVLGGMC